MGTFHKKSFVWLFPAFVLVLACALTGPRDEDMPSGSPVPGDGGGLGVPPPPDEDHGVVCFVEGEGVILAHAPSFQSYLSRDGGLTWQHAESMEWTSGADCASRVQPWELWPIPDGTERFRFTPGRSVERSLDSGDTWQLDLDLSPLDWQPEGTSEPGRQVVGQPGPLDAMIDRSTGNLLLAMGQKGVLVRLPGGAWQWAPAGEYAHGEKPQLLTAIASLPAQPTLSAGTLAASEPFAVWEAHTNYTHSLAFSPDGSRVASSGREGGLKVFSFPDGELVRWIKWGEGVNQDVVYGTVYSADGRTLVTCGTNVDQTLRFWEADTGRETRMLEGYQGGVLDAAGVSGRQVLAVARDSAVDILQLPAGEKIGGVPGGVGVLKQVKFLPPGDRLAMAGAGGGVELWDTVTEYRLFTLQAEKPAEGRNNPYRMAVALGMDGRFGRLLALFGDSTLQAWDIASGAPAGTWALPGPHGYYLTSGAISPDGSLVAAGFHNGDLWLFRAVDGRVVAKLSTSQGTLMRLAFSPDGQVLAAGAVNGELYFWQVGVLISTP